ncbi:nacht domain protein [Rutstroemia sp. NJR-2017a BBW]|nr:nacht domain protein [Rutstroemia sp. NJR-2017a BBW]
MGLLWHVLPYILLWHPLIDELQSTLCGVQQNVALAYYYCDYADKRSLTCAGLFSCIAQQLLRQKVELSESLMDMLDAIFPDETASASLGEIDTLLAAVINEFESVIVFIDGTDELPENDRNTTFQNLRKAVEVTASPIKLFVSGRADISYLFPISDKLAVVKVNIRKDTITSDINSYLRHSISELIRSGDLVIGNPSLEEDIFSALSAGAQGMFLWAKFQLDELCQLETDAAITKALRNLPRDLEETFDRLLQRVLGDERRELVKRMFNWIICARRPLHMDELREAIAFTVDDEYWDAAKIPNDLKRLVRVCGNLVIVDEETEKVQLAHHTVEQYLLHSHTSKLAYFHTTKQEANREIGEVCAAYLCFSDFETQVTRHNMITPNMVALQQVFNTQGVIPYSSAGVRHVAAVASVIIAPRKTGQHITSNIDFARHISKNRHPTEFHGKYCLLPYTKEHWLSHVESFTKETRQTTAGRLFRQLLFQKQFPFPHRPWDGFSLGESLLKCAIMGWAIAAGHLPILHELLAADGGAAFEYVARASHKFWKPLLNLGGKVTLVKIPERTTSCCWSLNNMTSENDCLEWLYVQILAAAQGGNFQVIQLVLDYGFTNSPWTASHIGAHSPLIASNVRAHLQLEASIHKQFDIVSLLSNSSHKIWASYERDGTYFTAVDAAMDCAEIELVSTLLEDGCPSSYRTSMRLLKEGEFTTAVLTERKTIVKAVLHGLLLSGTSRDPKNAQLDTFLDDAVFATL